MQITPTTPPRRLRVGMLEAPPFCGSTMFAMMCDTHPELCSVGEIATNRKIRAEHRTSDYLCSCKQKLHQCSFWLSVVREMRSRGIAFSLDSWPNDYRYESRWLDQLFSGESARAWVRALRYWADDWLPGHAQRIKRVGYVSAEFAQAVLKVTGKSVFVDTTKIPDRLHRLMKVATLDLRVINLVRDVRAFCASAIQRGRSIENAARRWKNHYLAVCRLTTELPSEHQMMLRYEDLCADPTGEFSRVCEFLEVQRISLADTIVPEQHHVLGNKMRLGPPFSIRPPKDFRQQLSRADMDTCLRIAGDLNESFGYRI